MHLKKLKNIVVSLLCMLAVSVQAAAQHDVMLQAFYWDVPVDAENKNGSWWDTLRLKSETLKQIGITGVWVPSPAKGNFGIYDMGYGIFDLYDLGNYQQKGTKETRFGSRSELENMISTMHANGIEVYADIVMNHLYTNADQEENNPEVKHYIFDEARRNGKQYSPYPTNEIKWVLKNAQPGKYYIEIHGYHLLQQSNFHNGFDLQVDFSGGLSNEYKFADKRSNSGDGMPLRSGEIMRDTISSNRQFSKYMFEVREARDVVIQLTARRLTKDKVWEWTDQTNGYYPKIISYNNVDLALTDQLEAHTNTNVVPVKHMGNGEQNFQLNYTHFHPAHADDSLGYAGADEIIPTTKLFGNDLNTYHADVQRQYQQWGRWLSDEIHFDGFRLDYVRGFQENFVSGWVKALPQTNDKRRFIVGEYWGGAKAIHRWVNNLMNDGVAVAAFDFPLKFTLTEMCNRPAEEFDMKKLATAGLVNNAEGFSLPDSLVVTFVENHDTGKEHDKWIVKDWSMAYAYVMTHPGRPCVFYNHLFGDTLMDAGNKSLKIVPEKMLGEEIRKLITIRDNYAYGDLSVLPLGDSNVYAASRAGDDSHPGCWVLINNHDAETRALTLTNRFVKEGTYVNALDKNQRITVSKNNGGRFKVPPRGYAIFVLENDFQPVN